MKIFCAVARWQGGQPFCVYYKADTQLTDEVIVAGLRYKWGSLAEAYVIAHEEVPEAVPTVAEAFE